MKFSIIVPVYNAQEYLQDCCESVLYQSYQDFELILVDDGSTDCSSTLCDRISGRFPERCIAVHATNQGPLLARQIGIRKATGDVLVFLDSDDCIRGDMLERLAECFRDKNCDVVLFNASEKEDYSNRYCNFRFQHLFTMEGNEKSLFYQMIACSEIPNALWLKAAKKHCFRTLPDFSGLSYVRNGEDLLMSLYMVTAANKIVYLDDNLYFYRQREGSLVHSYNPDRVRSIKMVHKELERFIDLWEMPELHPIHFAREVRSWIEALQILMDNRQTIAPSTFRIILKEMAEDKFFRHAFVLMDTSAISKTNRILAKWLYRRRFWCLHAAGFVRTVKNSKRGR